MNQASFDYPATLRVDPQERSDRLTVLFRLVAVIPILIVLGLIVAGGGDGDASTSEHVRFVGTAGVLFLPVAVMLVFRRKYPRWWFDWNLEFTRFSNRIGAYLFLLRDEYPSTDEEQSVHIDIVYPDATMELNRWLPLVKWLLLLPHIVILVFLWIAVLFCTVFAWFAILITGRYPRELHPFVEGVMRWSLRVGAYGFLLTTDRYPPFSLRE
ncbi:MAG: DUF4389 domain-containing protein [Alkalispirochaeta sp.]